MCDIEATLGKMIPHTVKDDMLSSIFPADTGSYAPGKGKKRKEKRHADQASSDSIAAWTSSSTSESHVSQQRPKDVPDPNKHLASPSNHSLSPVPSKQK